MIEINEQLDSLWQHDLAPATKENAEALQRGLDAMERDEDGVHQMDNSSMPEASS